MMQRCDNESGAIADSITGLNIHTIGAFERSAVVPSVMTKAVVTSHAVNIPSVSDMDDYDVSREFVDHLAPPTLFSQIREMDYHHLFIEFNVGIARQACLNIEVRMRTEYFLSEMKRLESECEKQAGLLKARDDEMENLKAQLLLKEAKVVKAARLQVLDRKVAGLQSSVYAKDLVLKNLNVVVHALKTICFGLCNQVFDYERLKEQDGLSAGIDHGKAGRNLADVVAYNPATEVDYNSALRRLCEMDFSLLAELKLHKDASTTLVDPLSVENLMGDADTSDSVPTTTATTNAMSTTFAFASSVPPITIEDYEIVGTDGPKDSQGNGQGNAASFPAVEFEKKELDTTPERITASVPYVSENGVSLLLDLIIVQCAYKTWYEHVVMNYGSAGIRYLHFPFMFPVIKQLAIKWWDEYGFVIHPEIREEFCTSSGPSDAGGNPPPITIHTWLERFNKQKPRSFEKVIAPVDAENWISHMEKIFDVMSCEDAFKTRLAMYKFEGNALAWWKAYKQAKCGDAWLITVTWADFKKLFFLQFFPRDEQERLKREYHSIRQTNTETSTEFMQRFLRLAGFLVLRRSRQRTFSRVFAGIPVMGVTRETGVSSPTDLPILVPSSLGVPLRATQTQFALRVDADTQESVVELLVLASSVV
nr:zinc finger, CCHC-type, retrotransposon Gag domain protein [Tanacetum cinerariifolium]